MNLNNGHPTALSESYFEILDAFQDRLGYHFQDETLLLRALTHSSYVNEHPEAAPDNQRLEFLGDAVLGLAVADWIFRRYLEFKEGEMTRLRAALVQESTIARFAVQLDVGQALRLGRGEAEGGGRERVANLGDAFEALVGALYLDGGLAAVRRVLYKLVEPAAVAILDAEADKDAKSQLQEWSQGELGVTPRYRIVEERGPDHAKTFVAEALLDDRVVGHGEGPSKQAAERAAARHALADGVSWTQEER
ncbi:MAG: ribonuclease III [Anaerolineae bacterium]|jgi:ribonuclease-3